MTGFTERKLAQCIYSTDAAGTLFSRGWALAPFDRDSTRRAQELFRDFLARKSPEERARWTCFIEDPNDPDYGYIRKGERGGEDSKHCFHWTLALSELLSKKEVVLGRADQEFLSECKKLYEECDRLARAVAAAIDSECSLPISFAEELKRSALAPAPFSRSTVRLSEYDSLESSKRAQVHRDRSLFTIHAGDTGGKLFEYSDEAGDDPQEIDVPRDMAVVFFGLKAELLTNGICRALWHGAEAEVGEKRSICTFFSHANYALQHTRE